MGAMRLEEEKPQRGFFTVSARDKDDLRAAGNGDREKRTDSVYILDRELKWIEEGCRGRGKTTLMILV